MSELPDKPRNSVDSTHIIPTDGCMHRKSPDCWCNPEVIPHVEAIYVHKQSPHGIGAYRRTA